MKKKNQRSRSNKYWVVGLSLCCILLMIFSVFAEKIEGPFRGVADITVIPMQKGINQIGIWIRDISENFDTLQEVKAENKKLKEQVEQLTYEIARLGNLSMEDTEEILEEFYQLCMTRKAITVGGMEYARTVLEKAFGDQTAHQLLEKITRSLKNQAFSFLRKTEAKDIFSVLQYERPQTIAIVLSYIDPDKAADVIVQLPEEVQIAVVQSIAEMDSVSSSAIKILEEELQKKFTSVFSNDNAKVGGIDYVASVMNNVDRSSEKSIFEGLEVENGELAQEIRKRMFVFEDIITMDDRSVQRFLRDCESTDLVLALKTAGEEVAQKLFNNMSSRMAESIRDDLEVITNVRIRDVEEAQQRIVDVIRALEAQGQIIIVKGGKDDIIA